MCPFCAFKKIWYWTIFLISQTNKLSSTPSLSKSENSFVKHLSCRLVLQKTERVHIRSAADTLACCGSHICRCIKCYLFPVIHQLSSFPFKITVFATVTSCHDYKQQMWCDIHNSWAMQILSHSNNKGGQWITPVLCETRLHFSLLFFSTHHCKNNNLQERMRGSAALVLAWPVLKHN